MLATIKIESGAERKSLLWSGVYCLNTWQIVWLLWTWESLREIKQLCNSTCHKYFMVGHITPVDIWESTSNKGENKMTNADSAESNSD